MNIENITETVFDALSAGTLLACNGRFLKREGDRFVMSGAPNGRLHRLQVEHTDAARLEAHWLIYSGQA